MSFLNTYKILKTKLIPIKHITCNCHIKVQQNAVSVNNINANETKLLKVAIIGAPNAGKSTLINSLVDSQICPTSKKVHTTRKSSRAIITEGPTQIVFVDTPGLVSSKELKKYKLEKSFLRDSVSCLKEANIIGVIHDASNSYTRDKLDSKVLKILEHNKRLPSFLVLNKVDLLKSKRKLLDLTKTLTDNCINGKTFIGKVSSNDQEGRWRDFSEIFMVSALNSDGVQELKEYLSRVAQPAPWMYDLDTRTDQSTETVIINTVKATLLDFLPQEIPYKLQTELEYFDTIENGSIQAVVLVKCPSPRIEKLVVGVSDGKLKQITAVAQRTLVKAFHCNVSLKIVTITV